MGIAVNRRGFLHGMLALGAAPAIVRLGSLMPVRSIVIPTTEEVMSVVGSYASGGGNTLLTIDMITKEALRILHSQMTFVHAINKEFAYDIANDSDVIRVSARGYRR